MQLTCFYWETECLASEYMGGDSMSYLSNYSDFGYLEFLLVLIFCISV